MSHEDEKSPSAVASPTAEVPTLATKVKATSERSSSVERAGGIDSQDERSAFARRDVSWTEEEERALVWRLGTLLPLDILCCLGGTIVSMISWLTRDRRRFEDHPACHPPLPLQLHRVSLQLSVLDTLILLIRVWRRPCSHDPPAGPTSGMPSG